MATMEEDAIQDYTSRAETDTPERKEAGMETRKVVPLLVEVAGTMDANSTCPLCMADACRNGLENTRADANAICVAIPTQGCLQDASTMEVARKSSNIGLDGLQENLAFWFEASLPSLEAAIDGDFVTVAS